MKINELFIADILTARYGDAAARIYDGSLLIQYLDKKMRAVHGDCKTRRSLANVYALYSILHFYVNEFYAKKAKYKKFSGYEFVKLFRFCRSLYGGSKLQNHALNSRVNFEFRNKFSSASNDLIVADNGKYLIHPDYLYVGTRDVSKVVCEIIEKYIELLVKKDNALSVMLEEMKQLPDYNEKRVRMKGLLNDDAEARVFEIVSYAILKNHFAESRVYFGYTKETVREERLILYKTGRTNANDGGIDFVMRPVGRFFQVTEVGDYDKYLLDMDKVMHFPVTFVIKTSKTAEFIKRELDRYIKMKSGGMEIIEKRYRHAIEDVITINELSGWLDDLKKEDVDGILHDIELYYRLEMNLLDVE